MSINAVAGRLQTLGDRISNEVWAAGVLGRAGVLPLKDPRGLLATVDATRRYGQLGAGMTSAATRWPDKVAIVDELGEITYKELEERTNRLANALAARGVEAGDGVALLARNHRLMLEAAFATFKLGGRLILLNSDFAGPQIREVTAREGARLLIHDDEWADAVAEVEVPLGRIRAWIEDATSPGETLDAVIASGSPAMPRKPKREGKVIVLTSGTTGTPKGAPRESPKTLVVMGGFFDKLSYRSGEVMYVMAPMFHAVGFTHGLLAITLGNRLVLQRRFKAQTALDLMASERAVSVVLVPTMLRRILDLGPEELAAHDLSSLRILFCAGSQLGADLCVRATQAFGPVVHNLYGSTEVSAVTIATPDELADAPDCVGTPCRGITLRLYDDQDQLITATGVTGRIFAGTGFEFEGYTGGGTKTLIDGLMATGDVGHIDARGRLFIDGRDDEMVVSGGENVFPAEIEELLGAHPEIAEAAAIGVDDPEYGARLRAFVVLHPGSALDEDGVKAHVRANLARFKVPREVLFIDELPRNPTGKVLKRKLKEIEP